MKRVFTFAALALAAVGGLFADAALLEKADEMYWKGEYAAGLDFCKDAYANAADDEMKFELAWRVSRTALEVADDAERDGISRNELLAKFTEAMEWAQKSIDLNPSSELPYYWKAANLGRWAETKGIFDALGRAPEMDELCQKSVTIEETHGDAWYLIGMVKYQLPGFAGGDKYSAVGADRKALAVWQPSGTFAPVENSYYYVELAKHLWGRKLSVKKRLSNWEYQKDAYASATDVYSKGLAFEGTIDYKSVPVYSDKSLSEMTDREEAVAILSWLKGVLESGPQYLYQQRHLDQVEDLLDDWT